MTVSARKRLSRVAVPIVILAVASSVLIIEHQRDTPTAIDGKQMILIDTQEEFPSESAEDWATYAEHVVVATVTDDSYISPASGEDVDTEVIGRSVELTTSEVVWSSDGYVNNAPDTFSLKTPGYQHDPETNTNVDIAIEGTPRLEVGSTYLMAILWYRAGCEDGSVDPGAWGILGSNAVIPYTGAVLGVGEFEGENQTLNEAEAYEAAYDQASLRAEVIGEDADEVASRLDAAPQGEYPKDSADYRPYCE